MALKSFIRIKNDEEFLIDVPAEIPQLSVSLQKALEYTEKNRPEFIAFERQKQEAKRDMAQAKAEKHEINFIASYGYNNAAATVNQVYQHLNQQQQLSLGFNIPLVDWGRRKARYDAAKAIEKLTEVNIEASRETILLEITTLVKNIDVLKLNVMLARKTDSVAQRRFSIADSLYQLGKLSVTDLNLAQSEKDNARRISITALRAYWNACYTLRRLTLYDFETNNPL
jgi:outer membrane protein TolC